MTPNRIAQIEGNLSKILPDFYYNKCGQRPSRIVCDFSESEIIIFLEDSVTKLEKTLAATGYQELAEEVRFSLDEIIHPTIKDLVESIINQSVIDLMSNTDLETGRTGIIVVLAEYPEVDKLEGK